MREIWQASGADADASVHMRTGGRRLLHWWWALYVVQALVAWLLGLFTRGGHGADAALTKASMEIVTSSLSIPAAIAAAKPFAGLVDELCVLSRFGTAHCNSCNADTG